MPIRFLKYGMIYIIPALFFAGVYLGSVWTFAPLLFAFGAIPLMELFFKPDPENVNEVEKEMRLADRGYDIMLYLIVPILYASILTYLFAVTRVTWERYELVGLTLSLGVLLGGMGINVAHELGHRNTAFEQTLSKILLLPSAYMHFFVEHNRGHHKNVSTHEDPASSRLNETVYLFWIRSVVYSFISAWNIEKKRLERNGKPAWSIGNEVLQFQLIQITFWVAIGWVFGWTALLWYTGAAVVGFLMLETVNYIEHYGLQRKKVSEFRYEKVEPVHSWNSDHIVGRVMLFELSRHSDHHYQPAKKYQVLDHHDHSPQMPTGYPGMMLLSLFPPLWFAVMNPKISAFSKSGIAQTTVQPAV
jgi:alkane 1-monooxygenase